MNSRKYHQAKRASKQQLAHRLQQQWMEFEAKHGLMASIGAVNNSKVQKTKTTDKPNLLTRITRRISRGI